MTLTPAEWIGLIVSLIFSYVVCGKICSKVGYSRWYGLVTAIPFVNLIALIMFAYNTWPIESKLMELESRNSREQNEGAV